jgi:hypothetical protein
LERLKGCMQPPELFLEYGEGIANDWDFVKSYLNVDVHVSKNKEFIHDVYFHLIPDLEHKYYVSSSKTRQKFDNEKNVIAHLFHKLETVKKGIELKSGDIKVTLSDVEKLMLTLSVYVDGYHDGTLGEHGINVLIQVWNRGFRDDLTYKIWNDRYPDEKLDINSLQNILEIVLKDPM